MYKTTSILVSLFILTGCAGLTPDFYRTVDDIATDEVLDIRIDKEAFAENPDVIISIEIKNKDGESHATKKRQK